MAWVKISEELYSSDQSNFSLEKIDGIWYVIDNSRQAKSIPFTDIFNNPVFPVDFSNADLIVKNLVAIEDVSGVDAFFTNRVFAKHFQAESADTPNTPALSFQGDLNSGIYRISEDKIGFSAGGSRQGEFGIGYGGFIGNIVQVVSGTNNFQTAITTTTFQDVNSASGVIWEPSITPKLANSRILVIFNMSCQYSSAFNNDSFGFKFLSKVNAGGTYATIYDPQKTGNDSSPIAFGGFNVAFVQQPMPMIHAPSYNLGDTLFYKVMGAINSTSTGTLTVNVLRSGTGTNSGHSEFYLLEVAS